MNVGQATGALLLWAGVVSSAAAQCDCATSSPEAQQCAPAVVAKASSSQLTHLSAKSSVLSKIGVATGDVKLPQLSPGQSEKVFDALKKSYGETNVAAAMQVAPSKLATLPKSKMFSEQVALSAKVLHPDGATFFLEKSDQYKMTITGEKAPKGTLLPDGQPSKYIASAQCWAKTDDPLKLKPDSVTAEGAYGSNFPEVGRIVRVTPGNLVPRLDRVCGFVMLSPNWALTALHCVADQSAGGGSWTLGNFTQSATSPWRVMLLGQPGLTETPWQCFGTLPMQECPWRKLKVDKILTRSLASDPAPGRSAMPEMDIALVKLSQPVDELAFPKFANPSQVQGTMTLVAYGTVPAPVEVLWDLQVGWNRAPRLTSGNQFVAWDPSKNQSQSSICKGDSGGAVFAGFENGGCRCSGGKQVPTRRTLAGVISYVELPTGVSPPNLLGECKKSSAAGAVFVQAHRDWICSQAPDIDACK